MRCVSANGFHGLTPDDCAMVIDFIAENSEDRQLSMRLLGPSLRKLQYARGEGLDWRPLIKSQLQTLGRKQQATKRLDTKSRDLKLLREAAKTLPRGCQEPNGLFLPAEWQEPGQLLSGSIEGQRGVRVGRADGQRA